MRPGIRPVATAVDLADRDGISQIVLFSIRQSGHRVHDLCRLDAILQDDWRVALAGGENGDERQAVIAVAQRFEQFECRVVRTGAGDIGPQCDQALTSG